MEIVKLEKILEVLTAVVPTYIQGKGRATEIYLKDGKKLIDSRTPKAIINEIAAIMAVDMGSLKRFCSHRLAIKNALPLPFAPNLMFVPLRVRKPIVPKDTATGYINFFSIVDVHKVDKVSEIEIDGGVKVSCIQSLKNVQVYLVYSRLIYREWQSVYVNPYIKEVGQELYKSARLDLIRNIMEDQKS